MTATGVEFAEGVVTREGESALGSAVALGYETTEGATSLDEILVLDGVLRRSVVRRHVALEHLVGDLVVEMQTVAQNTQLVDVHLLDLMRRVSTLDLGAERPTLHGLAQDRRRATRPEVVGRGLERRVHLAVVVTTAWECLQFGIGEV